MSKENRVSDERLFDLLARDSYRMYQAVLPMELSSMDSELQSLRSKPVAGVEVKPLIDAITKATDLLNVVILSGTSVIQGPDGPHSSYTPLATQANAVWCDLIAAQTILSALLPKATAPVVSERREIETEAEALQRLADGDRIVYSRDGEAAWFQNGDRAFVDDVVILDLHLSGLIETLNDGEDEDWHEWSQITDKGRAALTAALEARNG